jgi:hypothetical protein
LSPTSTAADTSTGKIVSPADGTTVRQCEQVTGRAVLAAGKTLLTAMTNVDNGDKTLYFQPVRNYDIPSQLASWKANQYFGSGETGVGQHYDVVLYSMDLAAESAALDAAKANHKDWTAAQPPLGAKTLDRVEVKRVHGPGPAVCS